MVGMCAFSAQLKAHSYTKIYKLFTLTGSPIWWYLHYNTKYLYIL